VDYNENLDEAYLLPAGRLREPVTAMGRATSLIVTKVPVGCDHDSMSQLSTFLRRNNKTADISFCQFRSIPSLDLHGARVVAFCGLAKPRNFFNSLSLLGARVERAVAFDDHHWFSDKDLLQLEGVARKLKADFFVTTEKDRVRIPLERELMLPVVTVSQETVWLGSVPQPLKSLSQKDSRQTSFQPAIL
jgi:tetraacyldisaccharide 4'-kinase